MALLYDFQIAFNRRSKEQVISRDMQRESCLFDVDSGESVPLRYEQTPLLMQTGGLRHMAAVARNFLLADE